MELDIIASVASSGISDIYTKIQSSKLRQNFTFLPQWYISDVIDAHGHDMLEMIKIVMSANWGCWSPKRNTSDFIQSFTFYRENNVSYHLILRRDEEEHDSAYLLIQTQPRYGNAIKEACVGLRVCDMDDNGVFKSDALDIQHLCDMQTFANNNWQPFYN